MQIIDGHPVPYSLTVYGAIDEMDIKQTAQNYLEKHKPDMKVTHTDGKYVFYTKILHTSS